MQAIRDGSPLTTAFRSTGFYCVGSQWIPSRRRSKLRWRRQYCRNQIHRRNIIVSSLAHFLSRQMPTPCSARSRRLASTMHLSNTANRTPLNAYWEIRLSVGIIFFAFFSFKQLVHLHWVVRTGVLRLEDKVNVKYHWHKTWDRFWKEAHFARAITVRSRLCKSTTDTRFHASKWTYFLVGIQKNHPTEPSIFLSSISFNHARNTLIYLGFRGNMCH